MEVGCLRHPGAYYKWRLLPWLANPGNPAMSPHAVRGAGTHHTLETVERGRERGGRGTAWAMSCYTTKCLRTPPVYTPHYDPWACGNPTHVHMCWHHWLPGECKHSIKIAFNCTIAEITHTQSHKLLKSYTMLRCCEAPPMIVIHLWINSSSNFKQPPLATSMSNKSNAVLIITYCNVECHRSD